MDIQVQKKVMLTVGEMLDSLGIKGEFDYMQIGENKLESVEIVIKIITKGA